MSSHQGWAVLAGTLLLSAAGCASGSSTSSSLEPAASACTPGMDQTCNDNAEISSIHGVCRPDGTCECKAEFAKNEATGRCK